ncbi:MAG: hemerythrin domain-containing protein [Elusimicrobia bacterium]|nr:hemerythrin domain-containing protein [Elusimicrobiota bacterium]
MATATGELLKDHKMIRKLLGDLRVDNPRVAEIAATLQRVTLAHAWFEDEFLMPLLKGSPLIPELFWQEITQEHNDIARLLELLRGTPPRSPGRVGGPRPFPAHHSGDPFHQGRGGLVSPGRKGHWRPGVDRFGRRHGEAQIRSSTELTLAGWARS